MRTSSWLAPFAAAAAAAAAEVAVHARPAKTSRTSQFLAVTSPSRLETLHPSGSRSRVSFPVDLERRIFRTQSLPKGICMLIRSALALTSLCLTCAFTPPLHRGFVARKPGRELPRTSISTGQLRRKVVSATHRLQALQAGGQMSGAVSIRPGVSAGDARARAQTHRHTHYT